MTEKPATFAERLQELMQVKGLTKSALAKLCDIDRSNITRYCKGDYEAKQDVVYRIAGALHVNIPWLMGYDVPMEDAITIDEFNLWEVPRLFGLQGKNNVIPIPQMRSVPLVGTIACGTPILAEQNIEGDVSAPDHVHADFALRCQGDSMINARIFDGDIVYIRQQETVDDGEIAAVLINDEATLKRVHLYEDHVVLEPENPQYRPLVYWGIDMNAVRILGKAVAFTSVVR